MHLDICYSAINLYHNLTCILGMTTQHQSIYILLLYQLKNTHHVPSYYVYYQVHLWHSWKLDIRIMKAAVVMELVSNDSQTASLCISH